MSAKWVILIVWVFLWMAVLGIVVSGSSFGSDIAYHLNVLSHWGITSESQTFGVLKYVRAPFAYFDSLFHVLTYNSPIFDGNFELVRWFFIAPILAGISFGLIILFFSLFNRDV